MVTRQKLFSESWLNMETSKIRMALELSSMNVSRKRTQLALTFFSFTTSRTVTITIK